MCTVGMFVGLFEDPCLLLIVPVVALCVATSDLRWCNLLDLGQPQA